MIEVPTWFMFCNPENIKKGAMEERINVYPLVDWALIRYSHDPVRHGTLTPEGIELFKNMSAEIEMFDFTLDTYGKNFKYTTIIADIPIVGTTNVVMMNEFFINITLSSMRYGRRPATISAINVLSNIVSKQTDNKKITIQDQQKLPINLRKKSFTFLWSNDKLYVDGGQKNVNYLISSVC
ncbi:MAG: hypothetical protein WC284_18980 [Candidimonas sp.]